MTEQQLELLPVEEEPWRKWRTPEQEAALQKHFAEVRQEAAEKLAWCNAFLGATYTRMQDISTADLKVAMDAYWEAHPQERVQQPNPLPAVRFKPDKPYRPYVPWTQERKWRERLRRLNERARKKYSMPEFRIPWVQDEITANPEYYGVCPLPGSVDACKLNRQDYDPTKAAAIERENQYRLIESEQVQPLNLPMKPLKSPEKVYEISDHSVSHQATR